MRKKQRKRQQQKDWTPTSIRKADTTTALRTVAELSGWVN